MISQRAAEDTQIKHGNADRYFELSKLLPTLRTMLPKNDPDLIKLENEFNNLKLRKPEPEPQPELNSAPVISTLKNFVDEIKNVTRAELHALAIKILYFVVNEYGKFLNDEEAHNQILITLIALANKQLAFGHEFLEDAAKTINEIELRRTSKYIAQFKMLQDNLAILQKKQPEIEDKNPSSTDERILRLLSKQSANYVESKIDFDQQSQPVWQPVNAAAPAGQTAKAFMEIENARAASERTNHDIALHQSTRDNEEKITPRRFLSP